MASKKVRLKVASPCKASWEDMRGDDAVRFCGACKKNVYSLSNMSTEAVEELLTGAGEVPCVRFFQRSDGTVLTSDCSIGAARSRRKRAVVAFGAGVLSAVGVALAPSPSTTTSCAVPDESGEVVSPGAVPREVPAVQPLEVAPVEAVLTLGQPAYVETLGEPMPVATQGEPRYIELRGKPSVVDFDADDDDDVD